MMNAKAQEIIVKGIVLQAANVGEADRRLVVLTKQLGKITVFAYGAKRQKSPLLAVANPFVCGDFTISRGNGAYRLQSVKCDNYFRELIEDFDKSCIGFYFLEFASYFTFENMECTDYLNLLYQSFKALLNKNIPDKLIRFIFELKMFTLNGEAPEVYHCFKCKQMVESGYFLLDKKCIVHSECGNSKKIELNHSAVYTLQYIISAPISKLYTFTVSDEVFLQIEKFMNEYRNSMITYKFKSAAFLV